MQSLNTPDQVLLVSRNIDKAGVWATPTPILDKHLTALDHLDVMILSQRPVWIDVKEGTDTPQYLFHILCVCLELIRADAFVYFGDLGLGVARGS